jgi:hypothetical protein
VKSILLVRLSAMGDLVQSLGAVASLLAAHPDWRVTMVTQREWAPLLDGVDGLDRVVHFHRRGGLPALWALRRELRRESYDVALDLQGNWKSAMVARLSGADKRIGMAGVWRQEPRSACLLQGTVECAATPHPARAAWELAKQVAPEAVLSSIAGCERCRTSRRARCFDWDWRRCGTRLPRRCRHPNIGFESVAAICGARVHARWHADRVVVGAGRERHADTAGNGRASRPR